jgi:hypothetical protein
MDALRAGALRIVLESDEPEPLPIHLVHAARGRLADENARLPRFRGTETSGLACLEIGRSGPGSTPTRSSPAASTCTS